jgi:hypothetical protein
LSDSRFEFFFKPLDVFFDQFGFTTVFSDMLDRAWTRFTFNIRAPQNQSTV